MNAQVFQEHELVSRKVKVGNDWQTKTFPVVGGRLRVAHENNERLSIQSEIVKMEIDAVVVKAIIETKKGTFNGTGTASAQRDARLSDSLVELAETRAIARALRFCGIGVEYTGAEEVSHIGNETESRPTKESEPIIVKSETNHETKPQRVNGATQAQCRALYALTKRAKYSEQDIASMLSPLNASTFQDLTREDASKLISYLQTEVAA